MKAPYYKGLYFILFFYPKKVKLKNVNAINIVSYITTRRLMVKLSINSLMSTTIDDLKKLIVNYVHVFKKQQSTKWSPCCVPGAGTGARGLLACAPPKAGELCWRRLATLLSGFPQT